MRITEQDIQRTIRSAFRAVALTDATDPNVSKARALELGHRYVPFTRERVAQVLGEEAAVAWEALRDAAEKFRNAGGQK